MGTIKDNDNQTVYKILFRLKYGLRNIYENTHRNKLVLLWFVVVMLLWKNREDVLNMEIGALTNLNMLIILLFGTGVLIYLFSAPFSALKFELDCKKMGMLNHLGEAPLFMYKEKDESSSRGYILHFKSDGVPLKKWIEKQSDVENSFNICIEQIVQGTNKKHIKIYACSGSYVFPYQILYEGDVLSVPEDVILLGENSFGETSVSLNVNPHMLIGGTTGSGKSLLLKFVLYQAIQKGYRIYLADFKGGVDFKRYWHERCTMIFDIDTLLAYLDEIETIIRERKNLLSRSDCTTIDKYNQKYDEKLERIVFACDEVAELLDKTGLTKEEKEKVAKVEAHISSIARIGRALGIHLVLAMQRPDATVLSGQIKNNVDCRICGRAESVLSQIILDNADASTEIPKNAQGLFLSNQGVLFKGYWIDEDDL